MERLNKAMLYGAPAQLYDAGSSKIKGLRQFICRQLRPFY